MKILSMAIVLGVFWVQGLLHAAPSEEATAETKKVDVLAEVRKMNGPEYASPPTKFRAGHVTARKLDPEAIRKTDGGYTIQLPSKAPVPTPAVYDGKVYVSGGFHSKEYYCFRADSGELVWGINLDDDGPSSAACKDGVIVFNTESCTIFAVEADTGKMLWSHWLGDPLMTTPTIAGGRVFTSYPARGGGGFGNLQMNQAPNMAQQQAAPVPQGNTPPAPAAGQPGKKRPPASHVLACLELKTGKILWQKWIDSDVMSAPVATGDDLYVTTFAGTVYRFKQASGKILSARRERATSAPVVVQGKVFYTQRADSGNGDAAEEALARLDQATGKRDYQVSRKPATYLDAAAQRASGYAAKGMQLDAGNGFAGGAPASANAQAAMGNIGQMSVSTLQAFQGSRVLTYGQRNFNCMGDEVICTDRASGKSLWKVKLSGDLKKLGGFLAAPPAAAGGQIFLATLQGEVLQLHPDTGKLTKRYKVGSPVRFQPVVVDGRIYVGTQDGKLVCLDTGDKRFTGWPMWGGNAERTGVAGK